MLLVFVTGKVARFTVTLKLVHLKLSGPRVWPMGENTLLQGNL